MAKFPYSRDVQQKSLHQLYTKQFYIFLANFFDTVGLDPTMQPDENGIWEIQKGENGKDWRFPVGGAASAYRSYFRVINATEEAGSPIVGITNGSAAMLDPAGYCGWTKINGVRVAVDATTESLTAAGVYYVWIHSWIDASTQEQCEIIVGQSDDDTPPDNPNSGVAFANQLAGRVTVVDSDGTLVISPIVQDYLRGGEHFELLFGDCAGEELA